MRRPREDDPDDVDAGRVMRLATFFQLKTLAERTAQTFQRARECTELTPAEVAAEMELILDRQSGDDGSRRLGHA